VCARAPAPGRVELIGLPRCGTRARPAAGALATDARWRRRHSMPPAVDRAVGAPLHHVGFTEPVRLVLELLAGHHQDDGHGDEQHKAYGQSRD